MIPLHGADISGINQKYGSQDGTGRGMNGILKNVSTLQLEKPDHESSHFQKPEERFQKGNYEEMNR